MNLKLLTGAAIAALAIAAPAQAETYLKAGAGQALDMAGGGVSVDGGWAFEGAIGFDVGPFRVEGGVTHVEGEALGGITASALDYTGTAYLDLPLGDNLELFGGVGAGYIADAEVDFGFGGADGDGAEWHWVAGAAYQLSDNLTAEVSYRRTYADVDFGGGGMDVEATTVMGALRFRI